MLVWPKTYCNLLFCILAPPEKEASAPVPPTSSAGAGGGELGEDMLQMALRMASEMTDEPVMDLENSLEPVAVNTGNVIQMF